MYMYGYTFGRKWVKLSEMMSEIIEWNNEWVVMSGTLIEWNNVNKVCIGGDVRGYGNLESRHMNVNQLYSHVHNYSLPKSLCKMNYY